MSSTFNGKLVLLTMGALLLIESFFMFLSTGVAYIYGEYDAPFFMQSSLITFAAGLIGVCVGRKADKRLGRREGYIIVALVWVVFSFFGLLPFYLSKGIPNFTDAFFETMSGFTTTGSSILTNIEGLPHGLLFWRSITQWLGGMGIIVLSLAILPMFGLGGMQLYAAEATGVTYEKIRPRIKDTAKVLWGIYLLLTVVEFLILKLLGMSWFDAVCHAFTTMSTGGYSTKNLSIASFDSPGIEYTITLFMFLAGINFVLLFHLLRGEFKKVWNDEESRYYIFATLLITLLISAGLIFQSYTSTHTLQIEKSFRTSLFQVVSIMTSTGYATSDYMMWLPVLSVLIMVMMLPGGSAGSTAGGMKWVRISILVKNSYFEFRRLIHPNAIIPIRLNNRTIPTSVINNVLAFASLYIGIIVISVLVLTLSGIGIDEAIGAAVTSISNIGPGWGASGPAGNFAHFPAFAKWFMSFIMLVGRLELFTVLFLFMPTFWKK